MKFQTVITKLNLASDPFRNRTLPYLLALALLAIAGIGVIYCAFQWRHDSQLNELALSHNREMEAQIKQLNDKGQQVQQHLSPEQQALLISAHKLVANKTFSWSRLFSDLESVLPPGVSASRISVNNVYSDGDETKADLEFSVISRDYPAVISMIDAMNNSGHFQAELNGQDLQKTDRITFTEYTLHLIYIPGYGYAASQNDIAQAGGDK